MSKGKVLSRDAILAVSDLERRTIEVPEWDGEVVIQAFSKGRQQSLRRDAAGPEGEPDPEKMEMLLFIYGVVEPQFTVEDYEILRQKSATAIDRILAELLDLSGMGVDAVRQAEAQFRGGS